MMADMITDLMTVITVTDMETNKPRKMKNIFSPSPKLIFKLLLMCSLILIFGCDDDDDDSSYGAIEKIQVEWPEARNGKQVVMNKA